jgi:predicted metal-dependent hydrolase
LIIHEICHTVASHWHGKKFQTRLLKAADRAQNMGKTDLADKLRAEAKLLRGSTYRPTAHDIYCQIADALLDVPDASMDAVFTWIADRNGYTIQELLKRYPKAERVYNQERKLVECPERMPPT